MSEEEPMSKREEQRLDTRRKILLGAAQLFVQSGIHDVSMNDLAEHLGVAKGTIFHHFENKETLIREVAVNVFSEEMNQLNQVLSKPDLTIADVKSAAKEIFHEFMEQPGFIKLILDYSSSFILNEDVTEAAKQKHSELMNEVFGSLLDSVPDVLVRLGVPENKALLRSHLLLSGLDGIGLYLYLDIIPNDHEYIDRLIDEFIDLLTQGE